MAVLSLEAREFECGAESLAAAASLQSLAMVMLATGRAAEAEALCQRCLKIRCSHLSCHPPSIHLAHQGGVGLHISAITLLSAIVEPVNYAVAE